jgi:iron complex outermembrane receptor protein
MKSCKSNLLVTLSLVVFPAISQAALGPIIITPTRTVQFENNSSATVYVVSREEIEKSGAKTTGDLLRGIPGIQIDDLFGNGTEMNISVRGFSSTANANTLVLVNGRRLNHIDTSSPDLHHIFPKDIERIEVLVGSAGSLYGDQAVGGVINIITRRWGRDYQQITMRSGSFDYKGIEFNSSKQLSDTLRYRLSAEIFQADHYRDHNAEENSNVYGVLEYADFEQRMFFEIQKIDDDLELPGALLKAEFDSDPTQSNAGFANDFINEDTTVSRIGYERSFGNQKFNIDATRRTSDADILQSFRNNPSPSAGFSNRKNISLNPKLSGIINSRLEIPYVVGFDLEQTDYNLNLPNAFGTTTASNEQENQSVFFQLNPILSEQLQLTFGMRRSSVENDMKDGFSFPTGLKTDDDITVKELGLAYHLDKQTKLTVRYDENFRFAKVNELAQATPGKVLSIQTGESFEVGVDLVFGDHQLVGSIYQLNLENEIEFDPTAGLFGENVNLDKTQRNGLTLSLFSQISPTFSMISELGLVNAKFKSGTFKGNDISGVASEVAKIRVDYQVKQNLTTYLEAQYTGQRYAQGDNGNNFGKLDSIKVLNAGLNYKQKAWDIHFRVNNLSDEKYAEFITNNGFGAAFQPSPERNFMLTASYQF